MYASKIGMSVATACAALALAACDPVVTGNPSVDAAIAKAQSLTVAACGFEMTGVQIANILVPASPAIMTGEAIAGVICAAATGQHAAALKSGKLRGAAGQTVVYVDIGGYKASITGKFVR